MYLSGSYVDVSGDVRQDPPVTITRGGQDESPNAQPGKCKLTLNDPLGNYNRRNPLGQYFGSLGKNTPLRIRYPLVTDTVAQTVSNGWGTASGETWVNNTTGSSGGTVAATNWTRSGTTLTHSVPAAPGVRVSDLSATQYVDSVTRYTLTLPTGALTGGAVATIVKLRTLDNSNYLGVQFIFRVDESIGIGVIDRVSGSDRSLQADTQIHPASSVSGGRVAWKVAALVEGQVVRAKVWSAADPEPLDWQTTCTRATVRAGTTGIISSIATGNSNTKPFAFAISAFSIEAQPFSGEIAEFTPGSDDTSNKSRLVGIEAADISRRLSQGQAPLLSTLTRWWGSDRRWIREGAATATVSEGSKNTLKCTDLDASDLAPTGGIFRLIRGPATITAYNNLKEDQLFTITGTSSAAGTTTVSFTPDALEAIEIGNTMHSYRNAAAEDAPVIYFPCEDEKGSLQIASGLLDGTPMAVNANIPPDFGANSSVRGSAPLPRLHLSRFETAVQDYTDTNQAFSLHFIVEMPEADEAATGNVLVQIQTTGTVRYWNLNYATGGSSGDIQVAGYDSSVTNLFTHNWEMALRGQPRQVLFSVYQNGGAVNYNLTALNPLTFGVFVQENKVATGATVAGKAYRVKVNPTGLYDDVAFGHLALARSKLRYFNVMDPSDGHFGEGIARRVARFVYETGVPVTYCPDTNAGPQPGTNLGVQQRDSVLGVLQDAGDGDMGALYGARGANALEYRGRYTLNDQVPLLELDAAAGQLLGEFTPVDDDQATRNDVTVTRRDGSSARYVKETGPLNVQDAGTAEGAVGRYDDSVTVGIERDNELIHQAGWRVNLGTVDEYRYPTMAASPANGVPLQLLLSVNIGSLVTVTNVQDAGQYEDVQQFVRGYNVVLHRYVPVWTINCTPGSPYNVLELDSDFLDSDETTLNEALDTTETGVDVAVAAGGALWGATSQPFDIVTGGERMTVTAVTGATSPQTLTVTRHVNAVTKTHIIGQTVHLADQTAIAY